MAHPTEKKGVVSRRGREVQRRVTTVEDQLLPAADDSDSTVEKEPGEKTFEETDDIRDFTGYADALHSYMSSCGTGTKEFTAKLYQYDRRNAQKQSVCHTSQNEMLTEEQVGMEFGSGDYRYLVTFPPETRLPPKAFRFNLHPVYDERRRALGMVTPEPQQSSARGGMMESMEMMKMVLEMVKPLLPASQPVVDPMQHLMGSYAMMQQVLSDSLKNTTALHKEIIQSTRANEGEDMGGTVTDQEEPGIVEKFMPLVEKFLPLLLGPGPQSELLSSTVKELPAFKAIVKNPAEVKATISELDTKFGPVQTNKILKALGVKRLS